MNLLMGNSDFVEPTRTANFSQGVFQPPQPISPAIRTDATAGLFMRWLVVRPALRPMVLFKICFHQNLGGL